MKINYSVVSQIKRFNLHSKSNEINMRSFYEPSFRFDIPSTNGDWRFKWTISIPTKSLRMQQTRDRERRTQRSFKKAQKSSNPLGSQGPLQLAAAAAVSRKKRGVPLREVQLFLETRITWTWIPKERGTEGCITTAYMFYKQRENPISLFLLFSFIIHFVNVRIKRIVTWLELLFRSEKIEC